MYKEGEIYKVINQQNGKVLADQLKAATTYKSRSKGLLSRLSLGPGEALLIVPCASIHTFFMKFSIDVLFLNKNEQVVKIVLNVKPWRLAGCFFGAHMVIEWKAGALEKDAVFLGNNLIISKN